MVYKIVFEKDVLARFQERIVYYENISVKVADNFHKDFFDSTTSELKQPYLFVLVNCSNLSHL